MSMTCPETEIGFSQIYPPILRYLLQGPNTYLVGGFNPSEKH